MVLLLVETESRIVNGKMNISQLVKCGGCIPNSEVQAGPPLLLPLQVLTTQERRRSYPSVVPSRLHFIIGVNRKSDGLSSGDTSPDLQPQTKLNLPTSPRSLPKTRSNIKQRHHRPLQLELARLKVLQCSPSSQTNALRSSH